MIEGILAEAKNGMHHVAESLRKELVTIRTGRASASLLDGVTVDYYGAQVPLNQCASVSTPDARLILVSPWDKNALGAIEKALMEANLGLTPQNDGKVIRLPIPPLSEERRKDLAKQARRKAEEYKVGVRNIRRDSKEMLEELEREGEASKDDVHRAVEELQRITDASIARLDELTAAKEKEILEF